MRLLRILSDASVVVNNLGLSEKIRACPFSKPTGPKNVFLEPWTFRLKPADIFRNWFDDYLDVPYNIYIYAIIFKL